MKTQYVLRTALWVGTKLIALVLVGFVLVCALVVMQGKRKEYVHADALLIIGTTQLIDGHVTYAQNLYQAGYGTYILLVGEQVDQTQETFFPNDQLAVLKVETTGEHRKDFHNAAIVAAQNHIRSVLIVDTPEAMLYQLKMARDVGLEAYGAPIPDTTLTLGGVLQSSLIYWHAVLF